MTIPAFAKDWLWALNIHTGPLRSAALRARLIRKHGITRGNKFYRQLPPGEMRPVGRLIRSDQTYLLSLKEKFGPIFKYKSRPQLMVAITSNELSRKFVAANGRYLVPAHKDLDPLFPIGHMRAMQGAQHRQYRQLFVRAMRSELLTACEPELRALIREEVAALEATVQGGLVSTPDMITSTRRIATRMLLRLLFGLKSDSPIGERLVASYQNLSDGYAPARDFEQRQVPFEEIRTAVQEQVQILTGDTRCPTEHSVLKGLIDQDGLDETSIGNLIYMVESGRFDLYSLFRWILYYIATSTGVTAEIRQLANNTGEIQAQGLAKACVLETLRSNQSEGIQRDLSHDVQFEGFFFPAFSKLRFCLWEAHKDKDNFPCPMDFDPNRFLNHEFQMQQFAPFGIDQHRCVASEFVVRLATLFIEELAYKHDVRPADDGPPMRGAYHWEPNPSFAFHLDTPAKLRSNAL